MKRVVSLSLGSSQRDKSVTVALLGKTFHIARVGVDGDERRFQEELAALDGRVDAIGFGGMDRYVWSAGRRYEFRAARRLLTAAKSTPVLDGSGLKNTLERDVVEWLAKHNVVDFRNAKTLMVCGVDRFGMSEALVGQGGSVVFGDLMFALGLPYAIRSWGQHRRLARLLLPVLTQMPLSLLYPMGEKQNRVTPKWERWYAWADVIAGDFHYIRRYMPDGADALRGKVILTNTTTEDDERELTKRGVLQLITTTPVFEGRAFATNVMEAVCVAAMGAKQELLPDTYRTLLHDLGATPTLRSFAAR